MTRRLLIVAPSYVETSGGRVALHLLCDAMILAGLPAAMYPWRSRPGEFATCPRYLSAVVTEPSPSDVVLYPDIVAGNPLGARHVIRWNLYHPRGTPAPTDIVFGYQAEFAPGRPLLRVIDPRLDVFRDLGMPRSGVVWTWRKAEKQGWAASDRPAAPGELPKHLPIREQADMFNRAERFVSYDSATFLTAQAKLCGCDVHVRARRPAPEWTTRILESTPAELRAWMEREQVESAAAAVATIREVLAWN